MIKIEKSIKFITEISKRVKKNKNAKETKKKYLNIIDYKIRK